MGDLRTKSITDIGEFGEEILACLKKIDRNVDFNDADVRDKIGVVNKNDPNPTRIAILDKDGHFLSAKDMSELMKLTLINKEKPILVLLELRTEWGSTVLPIILSDSIIEKISTSKEWDLLAQIWPGRFSEEFSQLNSLQHDNEVDSEAIMELRHDELKGEASVLTGQPISDVPRDLSLPFLIQLNVTRFGTLSIVAIAIGILSPLYRFSARMSAFYQARADAIRMQQSLYRQIGFVRLATSLTPQIDFGKTQMPNDHLVEIIKLISEHGKDGG